MKSGREANRGKKLLKESGCILLKGINKEPAREEYRRKKQQQKNTRGKIKERELDVIELLPSVWSEI